MHWDDPANRDGQDPNAYAPESESHYRERIEHYEKLLRDRKAGNAEIANRGGPADAYERRIVSPSILQHFEERIVFYKGLLTAFLEKGSDTKTIGGDQEDMDNGKLLLKSRAEIADRIFETYDFGEYEIVDHEGWEYCVPGLSMTKIFYIDADGDASQRGSFTVQFRSESSLVVTDASAMVDGEIIGFRTVDPNLTTEEPLAFMPGATMQLDRNSGMAQVNIGEQVICFGGESAIREWAAENNVSLSDLERLLALDAEGSGKSVDNQIPPDWKHAIYLNGQEIISGDRLSMGVIFNNLSGRNFRPELVESWRSGTHEEYLAFMGRELGVEAWSGAMILKSGANEIERHDFPRPQATAAPTAPRMRG